MLLSVAFAVEREECSGGCAMAEACESPHCGATRRPAADALSELIMPDVGRRPLDHRHVLLSISFQS